MDKELLLLLNEHMMKEFDAYFQYLATASFFEKKEFSGFAHWARVQAEEERAHAMKIYEHLIERDLIPNFSNITIPQLDFNGPEDAFASAYNDEVNLTRNVQNLAEISLSYKDYAAFDLMTWFAKEQIEEEDMLDNITTRITMAGNNISAMLFLDQELGKR